MQRQQNYTRNEILLIHANMQKYGGGFISALSEAIIKADQENLKKLQNAFPDEFEKYLSIGTEKDENKNILFQNQSRVTNLIPVHINKMRCDEYFWNWSSNLKDWVRGEKIPNHLKTAYKTPITKNIYK